jgi:DNA-binding IclR family transcriptional regulator
LARFTPNTITERAILRKHFQKIRREGYAYDEEEHDVGIKAVAAPIFDNEKKPIAAVVVAGPSQRITWGHHSTIVPMLKETAAKISGQFYYETVTG